MFTDTIPPGFPTHFNVPPEIKALCEPAHEALAQAVHSSSQSPGIRTVATTALVTTLWQMAGSWMSRRLPSLVFIPAGGPDHDPIDGLAKDLIRSSGFDEPGIRHSGEFSGGTVDLAPKAMSNAIAKMAILSKHPSPNLTDQENQVKRYFAAQRTGFGSGIFRGYSKAWHDPFGILCDPGRHLILRLDEDADRKAFFSDVTNRPEKLRSPVGIGSTLNPTPVKTAISGSLYLHSWNAKTTDAALELGLPLFMLPHEAHGSLNIANPKAIHLMSLLLDGERGSTVEPSPHLPTNEWFAPYYDDLRRRLAHLPHDFAYAVNTTLRELLPVCERIARFAGRNTKASPLELDALRLDLFSHTLRGMVLSVISLSWHCRGFDPGCPLPTARALLNHLRKEGPTSLRDLQRKIPALNSDQRDEVLGRLKAEGLVKLEGKTVTATNFQEFVHALHSDDKLPHPPNLWQVALEAKNTGER